MSNTVNHSRIHWRYRKARTALAALVLADFADQPDQHPHRLGRGDGRRRHARQFVRHRARLVSEGPALRTDGPAAAREQPLGLVGPTRRRPAADRHEPAQRDLHGSRPRGQARGKRHGRSRGFRPSAGEQPHVERVVAARAENTLPPWPLKIRGCGSSGLSSPAVRRRLRTL